MANSSTMRVLVACEFSGVVREAFRKRGHDAWSCDLLPALDKSKYHIQWNVEDALRFTWDMVIAHPPCTYLCRSGWHHVNSPDSAELPLKGEPRRQAAWRAAEFFKKFMHAKAEKICVENPRPIKHVGLPPASQYIQPWQFGHGETKETGLWLKGLPPLEPTNIVEGRDAVVHKQSPGMRGGLTRQQRRSITYTGIAEAMAEQWGALDGTF